MTGLEDTFGEEFAENIRSKTAERRQERNRVTEEQMAEICSMAINESKFEDGDPQFVYKTDNNVEHNVMLVQAPDPSGDKTLWDHLSEPWEGAAKIPLEYLGEWYWSTFPQKDDVKEIEAGDWYIVAGSVEENEGDNGDVFKNIYPVRGIASLDEAKQYAEQGMDEEGFADDDEDKAPEPDDFGDDDGDEEEEESSDEEPFADSDDSDDGGSSGGGLGSLVDDEDDEEEEDEDPVPYEDVSHFIEKLMDKQDEDEEPQIVDLTREHDQFDRVVEITCDQLELDNASGVADVVIDVIESHREEEEDEEDEEDELEGKLF